MFYLHTEARTAVSPFVAAVAGVAAAERSKLGGWMHTAGTSLFKRVGRFVLPHDFQQGAACTNCVEVTIESKAARCFRGAASYLIREPFI